MLTPTQGTDHYSHTEITRKQWKGKTTLMQYLSVIDVVHSIGRFSFQRFLVSPQDTTTTGYSRGTNFISNKSRPTMITQNSRNDVVFEFQLSNRKSEKFIVIVNCLLISSAIELNLRRLKFDLFNISKSVKI